MVEITDAIAVSGAIAKPTFIQPKAIISNVPPKMTPVVTSPKIKPTNVQATNGR